MSAHIPPRLAPKPGHIKVFRALYRYIAQQPDELSFEEGDTLYIQDMITDSNWWKAKCGNKSGLIPSNYVEESSEEVLHPLHEAAKRGNTSFLKECLSNKVSVNGLDKAGCTALHWAAHGGHIDCFAELLRHPGVQINVQNKLGDTPLHSAAWKGHHEIVKMLLQHGAQMQILNKDGKKPLDLTKDPVTAAALKLNETKTIASPKTTRELQDYGESGESD